MRPTKAAPYQNGKRMAASPSPTEFGAAFAVETQAKDYATWVISWATPAFSDTLKQRQSVYEVFYGKASKI